MVIARIVSRVHHPVMRKAGAKPRRAGCLAGGLDGIDGIERGPDRPVAIGVHLHAQIAADEPGDQRGQRQTIKIKTLKVAKRPLIASIM